MKKKFIGIIFTMLLLVVGSFSTVFAADDAEIGVSNLNNTAENSAKIGDRLEHPERGWKRYDDTNNMIQYIGETWKLNTTNLTTSQAYLGTVHYTGIWGSSPNGIGGEQIKFKFKGTKLRIITLANRSSWSNNISINIDGVTEKYTQIMQNETCFVLVYEKVDLDNKIHNVSITNNEITQMALDAIDIDENGELKQYNEIPSTNDSSISLNKSTDILQIEQTDNLVATVLPENVTNKNVTWKSSDESIATVDENGKVTAIKEGTATITATTQAESNLSASCIVTVKSKGTTPTNPTDNTGNAILTITMTNGNIKSYTVNKVKVDDFISWYNNRANGSNGNSYHTFDKTESGQPFTKKTEYIVFDKISSFEVDEYDKK